MSSGICSYSLDGLRFEIHIRPTRHFTTRGINCGNIQFSKEATSREASNKTHRVGAKITQRCLLSTTALNLSKHGLRIVGLFSSTYPSQKGTREAIVVLHG